MFFVSKNSITIVLILFMFLPFSTKGSAASEMTKKLLQLKETSFFQETFDIVIHNEPRIVPDVKIINGNGDEINLSNLYGKKLLAIHFWATWCIPCIKELPTLEMLGSRINNEKFLIVPISVDRGKPGKIKIFYNDIDIINLQIFMDKQMAAARLFRISGIPTTILINEHGYEIARVIGDRDWSESNIISLIQNLIN
tara:strand:+ start:30515 stop:31105 length:591 start_codon:yes stop_codon:yes gene_type:complete